MLTDQERKRIEQRIQQLRSQMRWVGPFRQAGKARSIQTLKEQLKADDAALTTSPKKDE